MDIRNWERIDGENTEEEKRRTTSINNCRKCKRKERTENVLLVSEFVEEQKTSLGED